MSLFSHFKNNLKKTSNFLSSNIISSFLNKKVDAETLEELESVLISADINIQVVSKLINSVRKIKTDNQNITKAVLETLSLEIEKTEENISKGKDQHFIKVVFDEKLNEGNIVPCIYTGIKNDVLLAKKV